MSDSSIYALIFLTRITRSDLLADVTGSAEKLRGELGTSGYCLAPSDSSLMYLPFLILLVNVLIYAYNMIYFNISISFVNNGFSVIINFIAADVS